MKLDPQKSGLINALEVAIGEINRLQASHAPINKLQVAVELGNFLIQSRLFETVTVDDGSDVLEQLVLDFFKDLTSEAGVAEHANRQFFKTLRDTAGASDHNILTVFKALTDVVGFAEHATRDMGKALEDEVTAVEDKAALFAKKVAEHIAAASDTINTVDVGKAFHHTSVATETHAFSTTKPLTDTSIAQDAHSLEPGKTLTHTATTTDTQSLEPGKVVEHVAELTEDEWFAVGKTLQHTAGISELLARNTAKPLPEDPAFTVDVAINQLNKTLHGVVGVTDDIDGEASILDDQEMQFTKVTTDVVGFSDHFEIVKITLRDFLDSSLVTDLFAMYLSRTLAEQTAFASDQIKVVPNKVGLDTVGAGDTDIRTSTAKPLTQTAAVIDEQTLRPGKLLTEQASTTDTGLVRSQSYSDFTYFSEDYVGASRTF